MKTTHTCPKCGGKEIYNNEPLTKTTERATLPVTTWKSIYTSVYVCVLCGYFEEYITEKELQEGKMIEKIKATWQKMG